MKSFIFEFWIYFALSYSNRHFIYRNNSKQYSKFTRYYHQQNSNQFTFINVMTICEQNSLSCLFQCQNGTNNAYLSTSTTVKFLNAAKNNLGLKEETNFENLQNVLQEVQNNSDLKWGFDRNMIIMSNKKVQNVSKNFDKIKSNLKTIQNGQMFLSIFFSSAKQKADQVSYQLLKNFLDKQKLKYEEKNKVLQIDKDQGLLYLQSLDQSVIGTQPSTKQNQAQKFKSISNQYPIFCLVSNDTVKCQQNKTQIGILETIINNTDQKCRKKNQEIICSQQGIKQVFIGLSKNDGRFFKFNNEKNFETNLEDISDQGQFQYYKNDNGQYQIRKFQSNDLQNLEQNQQENKQEQGNQQEENKEQQQNKQQQLKQQQQYIENEKFIQPTYYKKVQKAMEKYNPQERWQNLLYQTNQIYNTQINQRPDQHADVNVYGVDSTPHDVAFFLNPFLLNNTYLNTSTNNSDKQILFLLFADTLPLQNDENIKQDKQMILNGCTQMQTIQFDLAINEASIDFYVANRTNGFQTQGLNRLQRLIVYDANFYKKYYDEELQIHELIIEASKLKSLAQEDNDFQVGDDLNFKVNNKSKNATGVNDEIKRIFQEVQGVKKLKEQDLPYILFSLESNKLKNQQNQTLRKQRKQLLKSIKQQKIQQDKIITVLQKCKEEKQLKDSNFIFFESKMRMLIYCQSYPEIQQSHKFQHFSQHLRRAH